MSPTATQEKPATEGQHYVEEECPSLDALVQGAIKADDPALPYEPAFLSLLANLSIIELQRTLTPLTDHFKRRLSKVALDKAVKAERKKQKRAKLPANPKPGQDSRPRPVVQIGGQMRDVTRAALSALALANKENPTLFVQSGRLVTICFNEKRRPTVEPLSLSALRRKMTLSADYVAIRETSDDVVAVAVDPPLDIARQILEALDGISYPFPALAGITELPIIRADGTICQTPGYDPETEQVYIPGELIIPDIPETPTLDDVHKAITLIDYMLSGFPFEDASSRATIFADLVTVVIRSVITGQVPLTLLDAPKQGSGKTLLAFIVGIVSTGRILPTNAPTTEEEEWRKRILTWLQSSPSVVIIDNLIHPLESSSLNSTLTTGVYEDRLLSTNQALSVRNRAVWFVTGNNIRVGDDTTRRCIKCRLDAKTEKPWKRKPEEFEIENILQWTLDHRAELVAALLTIARYWYAIGKPKPSVTPIGSFEEWTIVVGGILQAAGISDFLSNLEDEDGNSSIDEVSAEWKAFTETIYGIYGDTPFTCSELAKKMLPETDETAELLREMVPTSVTKNLSNYLRSSGIEREFPKHLGTVFNLKKGQMFGTLRLEWHGRNRQNKVCWQIVDTSKQPPTSPDDPSATPKDDFKRMKALGDDRQSEADEEALRQSLEGSTFVPVEDTPPQVVYNAGSLCDTHHKKEEIPDQRTPVEEGTQSKATEYEPPIIDNFTEWQSQQYSMAYDLFIELDRYEQKLEFLPDGKRDIIPLNSQRLEQEIRTRLVRQAKQINPNILHDAWKTTHTTDSDTAPDNEQLDQELTL